MMPESIHVASNRDPAVAPVSAIAILPPVAANPQPELHPVKYRLPAICEMFDQDFEFPPVCACVRRMYDRSP